MYQGLRAFCNNVTKKSQINNIYINKKIFLKEKIFVYTYEVKIIVTLLHLL